MTAQCRSGSDTPEHTTETEFSLELSASEVHGVMELCGLTSSNITIARRGLKVKVIGQGKDRGSGYNAVGLTSIESICF